MLCQGLVDTNHTVVNQAFASVSNVLPMLMQRNHRLMNNNVKEMSSSHTAATASNINDHFPNDDDHSIYTMEKVIDKLLLVFDNKYWVVQCRYCDLISKLDFDSYRSVYGDRSQVHKVMLKMCGQN